MKQRRLSAFCLAVSLVSCGIGAQGTGIQGHLDQLRVPDGKAVPIAATQREIAAEIGKRIDSALGRTDLVTKHHGVSTLPASIRSGQKARLIVCILLSPGFVVVDGGKLTNKSCEVSLRNAPVAMSDRPRLSGAFRQTTGVLAGRNVFLDAVVFSIPFQVAVWAKGGDYPVDCNVSLDLVNELSGQTTGPVNYNLRGLIHIVRSTRNESEGSNIMCEDGGVGIDGVRSASADASRTNPDKYPSPHSRGGALASRSSLSSAGDESSNPSTGRWSDQATRVAERGNVTIVILGVLILACLVVASWSLGRRVFGR